MQKKFNRAIDCVNCAAKIEDAINKLDGVEEARVNFMAQKFTLVADDDRFDEILEAAIKTGKKIEPDFTVEMK